MERISLLRTAITISVLFMFFTSCATDEPFAGPMESAARPAAETLRDPRMADIPEGAVAVEAVPGYNPYLIENVRRAAAKSGSTRAGDIQPTHLYVRFRPVTDSLYRLLRADEALQCLSRPLDVEAPEGTMCYVDYEHTEGTPFFLFANVPVDYFFPAGIDYDILGELVLQDDLTTDEQGRTSGGGAGSSPDSRGFFIVITPPTDTNPGDGHNLDEEHVLPKYPPGSFGPGPITPRGRIRVWDSALEDYIPLVGLPVIVSTGVKSMCMRTDSTGRFQFTQQISSNAHYAIEWSGGPFIMLLGSSGPATFVTRSNIGEEFNLDIGSGRKYGEKNHDMQIHFATVWRAAQRYFHGDTGGLGNMPQNGMLPIAVYDGSGTSMMLDWNTLTIPKPAIYTKYAGSGYKSTQTLISSAFHELGHVQHYYKTRKIFGMNDFFKTDYTIIESWGTYVKWHLMQVEYQERGLDQEILNRWRIGHDEYGKQAWPYTIMESSDLDADSYTSLFIDLVDDYNQNVLNTIPDGMTLTYPNDNITGYTPDMLLGLLPQMRGNLDFPGSFMNTPRSPFWDVKSLLKLSKPPGVTDAQLDQLMERYNQYWVGQWINGL